MFIQIILIGLIMAAAIVLLRQIRPEFAIFLSVAAGIALLVLIVIQLTAPLKEIQDLFRSSGTDTAFWELALKAVGMAYLAEFAAQACRDSGENAIAQKIELGGKVAILAITIPALTSTITLIIDALS